jgi:hypothetical protein
MFRRVLEMELERRSVSALLMTQGQEGGVKVQGMKLPSYVDSDIYEEPHWRSEQAQAAWRLSRCSAIMRHHGYSIADIAEQPTEQHRTVCAVDGLGSRKRKNGTLNATTGSQGATLSPLVDSGEESDRR